MNYFLSLFKQPHITHFTQQEKSKKGKGFTHKGVEYVHHSDLELHESAFYRLSSVQKLWILASMFLFFTGLVLNWYITVVFFISLLTLIYFFDLLFILYLIFYAYNKNPEITITEETIEKNSSYNWPFYTVLCPLYKEWKVIPQFVNAMSKLDYPKEKLQVILLLEEDDRDTLREVNKLKLPPYFEVRVVPDSLPKTKPKAMNFGLLHVKGEYCVVYDAEDMPDSKQLKKAVLSYNQSDSDTICLQAKLNFYNPHHNVLTKLFTAEYCLWFDLFLTGLQSISAPIPLGGTSNHFKTSMLKQLKGWDAFNVTEDCDLGMRIAKYGYKTAIFNSITYEEANSNFINWLRQRSRWIKGYIQTYLVHMRRPGQFRADFKKPHLITFQLIVGSKIASLFINPFMWILTISYFVFRPTLGTFIESFFPTQVFYVALLSLIIGNFLYLYNYMIGVAKKRKWNIMEYVFLVPFYWLMMSIASWLALYQLIFKPHYWEKTVHGYHLDETQELLLNQDFVV